MTPKSMKRPHTGSRCSFRDAKANFGEVIRRAQRIAPQRTTLHGRDVAIVLRAEEFDRLRRPVSGRDIVSALASSPLADVAFARSSVKSPVHGVGL